MATSRTENAEKIGNSHTSRGSSEHEDNHREDWQGKVPAAKAEEYAEYIFEAGVKSIQRIAGNLGVQVLRRTENELTEFTTISFWESFDAIRLFAGQQIEKPHHLPKDPDYLIEPPQKVVHCELDYCDVGNLK